jgi:glycosyltransferase involved in cell wall biosynthesis
VKALADTISASPQTETDAEALPGLTVILPCHNEEENVAAAVSAARSAARRFARRCQIVVVDDGSTDGTGQIAAQLERAVPEVRLVSHEQNGGYGAAVRSGIRAATMPWILLTDGDLQFDLLELEGFLPHAARSDLVVGRRANRADPLARRVAAGVWNTLVRVLFRLPVRDVDCAFKLMRADAVRELPLSAEGAMVSTELLARALQGGATVIELDVHHRPRIAGEQSGGNPRVIARALRELVALRRDLRPARA